jgi:hypothetical protein
VIYILNFLLVDFPMSHCFSFYFAHYPLICQAHVWNDKLVSVMINCMLNLACEIVLSYGVWVSVLPSVSVVIRYMCLWMQYHDDKARVKDTMKAGKVGHCCIFSSSILSVNRYPYHQEKQS